MNGNSYGILITRIKRCVTAIKIFVAVMGALVIALVMFAAVAAGTGLNVNNPLLTLSLTVVFGGLAVLAAVGLFAVIIVAYRAVSALKKEKPETEEPNGSEADKVE